MKKIIFLTILLTNNCFALTWECIKDLPKPSICRTKITTGWLVYIKQSTGYPLTFVMDPKHKWKI